MSESLAVAVLTYVHVLALSLWFGGLFGYVVIVWPAIMSDAGDTFPRALLAGIWMMDGGTGVSWMAGYGLLLIALVANNAYGTIVAWPRIMLQPQSAARNEWYRFRVRMTISLVVGLALHAAAILAR